MKKMKAISAFQSAFKTKDAEACSVLKSKWKQWIKHGVQKCTYSNGEKKDMGFMMGCVHEWVWIILIWEKMNNILFPPDQLNHMYTI